MLALLRRPLYVLPIVGTVAILTSVAFAAGATAQSASGTVTGRVLWSGCLRAIPLPASPDAQAQTPEGAQPGAWPAPDPRPDQRIAGRCGAGRRSKHRRQRSH